MSNNVKKKKGKKRGGVTFFWTNLLMANKLYGLNVFMNDIIKREKQKLIETHSNKTHTVYINNNKTRVMFNQTKNFKLFILLILLHNL